jgi:hypothetical protein
LNLIAEESHYLEYVPLLLAAHRAEMALNAMKVLDLKTEKAKNHERGQE